ncbi:hypothetical protein FSB78_02710 [Sphingomonas ginsenosidivorax]|jgi:hypothetical protein|uniref:Uncharacterized protein n=1 Tax=Sphingomonas ginsenosidivorax TaxID=862135 RepID=A0A5C6UBC7_9SPHN|nr:hypothetical protein [Sphingomonas ginsenosidivorax]TXC69984.1 hypothetical protein FSB78_02710 [Sphingomonas ginsenosidivorax]
MPDIDQSALDSLSVAPDGDEGRNPRQDAGQDKSIAKRLQKNPDSADARLDNALDESMDGSDPVSQTQPGANTDAPESSGYNAETEKGLTHKQA